jgi:hypothetical protein
VAGGAGAARDGQVAVRRGAFRTASDGGSAGFDVGTRVESGGSAHRPPPRGQHAARVRHRRHHLGCVDRRCRAAARPPVDARSDVGRSAPAPAGVRGGELVAGPGGAGAPGRGARGAGRGPALAHHGRACVVLRSTGRGVRAGFNVCGVVSDARVAGARRVWIPQARAGVREPLALAGPLPGRREHPPGRRATTARRAGRRGAGAARVACPTAPRPAHRGARLVLAALGPTVDARGRGPSGYGRAARHPRRAGVDVHGCGRRVRRRDLRSGDRRPQPCRSARCRRPGAPWTRDRVRTRRTSLAPSWR